MRRFLLDRLYPVVLSGLPTLGTPQALAAEAKAGGGSIEAQADRLVRRHFALSGATGFATGLGGWLLLPVTLPTDLAGNALIQLHMAASIASLAGHNPAVPAVRERVVDCLVGTQPGNSDADAQQETLDRVGVKLAEQGIQFVVATATGAVKWGAKKVAGGAVRKRLFKGIPLLGGFLGAASDTYVASQVARSARDTFIGGLTEPKAPDFPPSSGDGLPDDVVAPRPAAPDEA